MAKLDNITKDTLASLKKNIKSYCNWCLVNLPGTLEYYIEHGNICGKCSSRVEKVVKHLMIKEEADSELLAIRNQNELKKNK